MAAKFSLVVAVGRFTGVSSPISLVAVPGSAVISSVATVAVGPVSSITVSPARASANASPVRAPPICGCCSSCSSCFVAAAKYTDISGSLEIATLSSVVTLRIMSPVSSSTCSLDLIASNLACSSSDNVPPSTIRSIAAATCSSLP